MLWDSQFGWLSNICKKCENSEPIPEYGEIRCSSCNVVSKEILFWDIKGTTLLKTCQVCRNLKNKKYRENKKVEANNSSIKSKSYSSPSTPTAEDDVCMTTVVSSQNMPLIIQKII